MLDFQIFRFLLQKPQSPFGTKRKNLLLKHCRYDSYSEFISFMRVYRFDNIAFSEPSYRSTVEYMIPKALYFMSNGILFSGIP